MSLAIVIGGADFSASKLPRLQATREGFPAVGLAGLYLLKDGVNGVHSGVFTDSSGAGNNGSVLGDYDLPAQRDYGVEITSESGLVIDTGIQLPSEFTVIGCLRSTMDNEVDTGFPTWFGDTQNGIPSTKSASASNSPRLAPNQDFTGSGLATNGVFSGSASMLPSIRQTISAHKYGSAAAPAVMAMRIKADTVTLKTINGYQMSHSDANILSGYQNQDGNIVIGYWKHGSSLGLSAELYGFAIYDRALTDLEIDDAMSAMYDHVSARGVAISR